MSSSGGVKGHRQVQSLPEDYYTPVAEMETNHILKSTLTGESRQEKGDSKTCLFCGFSYYFRPIHAGDHLVLGSVSKKVEQCKPSPEHIQSHVQVVKEVKRRDEHEKIQVREMDQRSLESGQADDDIDVEKFGKRPRSSNNEITRPFQRGSQGRPHDRIVWSELHQDQTWWCKGTHTVKPHLLHHEPYPKTRQVDRRKEHGEDEGNDTHHHGCDFMQTV
jgi:hypothetical protein